MIVEIYNLLSQTELDFLNAKCLEFDTDNFDKINRKTSSNYYNRVFVANENLEKYYFNLKNTLEKEINPNIFNLIDFSKNNSWINKVIPETNKNDNFHNDMSFLTAVTYLNDDFTKGEFEYKDDDLNIHQIKPEKNKTLIMDEKLLHRVSPVKNGIRYSLVTFFQFESKEKKTLL
jgi:hypothetical protein